MGRSTVDAVEEVVSEATISKQSDHINNLDTCKINSAIEELVLFCGDKDRTLLMKMQSTFNQIEKLDHKDLAGQSQPCQSAEIHQTTNGKPGHNQNHDVLFAGYIRHAQVREYSHCRPTTGPRKCTNLLATTIGLVSVIGLFIVANWQMTSAIRVHYFGSQCCFYGANIYFIFQTVFSFWMAPQLNSLQIFVLRALLSLLMVSLNIGTNVCNYMAWKLYNNFNPNSSYKDHLLWNPTDPGYGWHLAYTIMEWCLMLTLSLAVLSFFPDFQRIKLEEPAIKMKRLWKDERSSTSRV
ncbi:DNA damage-regulated autophagy modulator protein 2-like [Macrosteles quadrilineatus]|uniref:DNA damage-regulated autophagy modulator protein 2-like n=1 Tax=Macrosteles quadrilineatus TaxID=74068 RepID=UPI0023E34D77|nr:DNA damage-regulated autophagy modulator protein 2-like [Macrosteles quadrilineatus]